METLRKTTVRVQDRYEAIDKKDRSSLINSEYEDKQGMCTINKVHTRCNFAIFTAIEGRVQ